MTDRPILFSAPMVRAILDGRKTQTRRVIRDEWWRCLDPEDEDDRAQALTQCPYGAPGDRLWVRERFASLDEHGNRCAPRDAVFALLADGAQVFRDGSRFPGLTQYAAGAFDRIKWRPSIHMPRWASRIALEVTGVRVERLQSITEDDAQAEGATPLGDGLSQDQHICGGDPRTHGTHPYTLGFACLWDEINMARAPWVSNPWVWVVEFWKVIE